MMYKKLHQLGKRHWIYQVLTIRLLLHNSLTLVMLDLPLHRLSRRAKTFWTHHWGNQTLWWTQLEYRTRRKQAVTTLMTSHRSHSQSANSAKWRQSTYRSPLRSLSSPQLPRISSSSSPVIKRNSNNSNCSACSTESTWTRIYRLWRLSQVQQRCQITRHTCNWALYSSTVPTLATGPMLCISIKPWDRCNSLRLCCKGLWPSHKLVVIHSNQECRKMVSRRVQKNSESKYMRQTWVVKSLAKVKVGWSD